MSGANRGNADADGSRRYAADEITRRRFLRSAGAAMAGAALGAAGCARSPLAFTAGDGRPELDGFDHAGIWWFHPGVLEYALGPWQPYRPPNPDQIVLWKQAIDWLADQGLNFAVLHIAPYGGETSPVGADRVRFGWGYHYVLDFDEFPEARVFDSDFVRRNQDILRAVTDYGKRKGVAIYFHDYNFMAPKPFIEAHPEIFHLEYLRRGEFKDMKPGFADSRKVLHHDICWNKPLYREFMASCYRELFRRFPATAGVMATPGERARCRCVECIGEQPDDATASQMRYRDSEPKRRTIANFCEVFAEAHKAARKKPLVRTWVAGINEEWVDYLPKGVTYVTKYSVFDLFDGGPDPQIHPWLAAGHDMWFMKEITGGENAGPVVMAVPEIYDEIREKSRALGIKGLMAVDNAEHGFTYKTRRVLYTAEVLFANSVRRDAPPAWEAAERYYEDIFGEIGPEILAAARQASEVPFQIPRVIYERLEGFTWRFPFHFADFGGKMGGWPGTLGANLDGPDWATRGIVPLETYVRRLKNEPWDDGFRARVAGEGQDPIEFLRRATATAEEGLRTLEALASRVAPDARDEMDLLIASANLSVLTGRQWASFMEARLYYAAALSPCPAPEKRLLAARCIVKYVEGIEALKAQRQWLDALPADTFDRQMTINPYERNLEKYETTDYDALRAELAPWLKQR